MKNMKGLSTMGMEAFKFDKIFMKHYIFILCYRIVHFAGAECGGVINLNTNSIANSNNLLTFVYKYTVCTSISIGRQIFILSNTGADCE
jgi:hypothetical protein